MTERTTYDDWRDLVEGRLSPADADAVQARLAADPSAAAEFAEFRAVHELTAPPAVPPTGLDTDAVAARVAAPLRRLPTLRIAAAAAVLVAVAAGAAYLTSSPPREVALRAISFTAARPAFTATPASVPSALADYRPVAEGRVHWLDSLEAGKALAHATGRPVFLWIYHPTCPFCVSMDREAFRDPAVEAKASEFVPVRLNVMTADPALQALCERGWPYFGILSSEGRPIAEFTGLLSAAEVSAELDKSLGKEPHASWDAVGAAANALRRGAAAYAAGRHGDAWREFETARAAVPSGVLGEAARAGQFDVAQRAAEALRDAQRKYATDEAAGARSLSEAAESFRGTPFGTDLAEVEQELRATRRFPVLTERVTGSTK